MCVVSMIGDHYRDRWPDQYPWAQPWVLPPNGGAVTITWPSTPAVSREEFEALRRDVLEMKELLKKAKAYDERNNEPECEVDEKMDVLRRVAKLVGVDLDDVLGKRGG